MIVPLLPAFLATLSGVPAMALGWIEGVAETTASFAKIVSGRFTDRAKAKKPLVLLGYGLSSIARPVIGLAPSWPAVVFIRFVDRIGKGVRTAPRDTMIANAVSPERRGAAYGLHRGFDNAGAVLGPLVAAGLVGWLGLSLRSVFLLAAIPATLSLLVLAFGVKETSEQARSSTSGVPPSSARELAPLRQHAPASEGTPPRSSRAGAAASGSIPFEEKSTLSPTSTQQDMLGSEADLPPVFWRAAWLIAFFTLAASSDTFLLLKAREVGIAAGWLPVLWAFSNAVKSAFSMWGGALSDRFGRRRLLLAAWILYAACYAGFSFVETPWPLVALVGVYSFYYPLSEGTERALVADLVPASARGRAFGWMNGLMGFAALPASAGFGLLWEHAGSKTAFLAGAAIAGVAAAGLLALRFPRPRPAG